MVRPDTIALVGACAWPSEAYWRVLELEAVRRMPAPRPPVLELGCGDGTFTELAGLRVDHAIDREPNAVARASLRNGVYGSVSRLDAHELGPELGRFGTIFANRIVREQTLTSTPIPQQAGHGGGTFVSNFDTRNTIDRTEG